MKTVFLLLAPFSPHISEEAWRILGGGDSIFREKWPQYRQEFLRQEQTDIAVIMKGKVKAHLRVPVDISSEEIQDKVLALEKVKNILGGNPPKKVVYVPGRLVNIVF